MPLSKKLYDAIVDGKPPIAQAIVQEELAAGADPMALVSETMIPAMDEVGKLFQEEEYFVPELMLAGRAMKAAMEPLRPLLAAAGAKPAGVIIAGTVKGDLHDIGKNLVISMLEGAGFKVIDLGTDVTPQKFVEAIREHQPHILCLSALLTVTARPRYALFGTDGVVHAAIHINQLSLGCSRPRRRAGRPRNFARLRFRLVSLCARYRAPTELALSRRRHRLTPPAHAWPQRRPSAPARRSARPVGRRRTSRRR